MRRRKDIKSLMYPATHNVINLYQIIINCEIHNLHSTILYFTKEQKSDTIYEHDYHIAICDWRQKMKGDTQTRPGFVDTMENNEKSRCNVLWVFLGENLIAINVQIDYYLSG